MLLQIAIDLDSDVFAEPSTALLRLTSVLRGYVLKIDTEHQPIQILSYNGVNVGTAVLVTDRRQDKRAEQQ